jgi:hypothetical protein
MRPRLSSTPFKLLQQSTVIIRKSRQSNMWAASTRRYPRQPPVSTGLMKKTRQSYGWTSTTRRYHSNNKTRCAALTVPSTGSGTLSNTYDCNETLPQQAAALYNKGSRLQQQSLHARSATKLRPQVYLHTRTITSLRPQV